jgi:hypothetical protein
MMCVESRKAGLMINYAKTEEIGENNILDRTINREAKRVKDFCYLGSTVSANGGATLDVSRRIQKARGAFAKLRKVWQSTFMNRNTKIRRSMLVLNLCFYMAVRPGWSQKN